MASNDDKQPSSQLAKRTMEAGDSQPPVKQPERLPDGSLPDDLRKEIFTDRGISATSGLPPTMKLVDYFADCPLVEPKGNNDKPADPQTQRPPT